MPTTLVVTNDFPPTVGGIEAFVDQICHLLGDVVVLTRDHPEAAQNDRRLAFPVHRHGRLLLPTPDTLRRATDLMDRHDATRVVFGAAAPLGLLAGPLRRAGARRQLAVSHGHETWWARVPATRPLLRRIGDEVDAVSYISDFTRGAIAGALSPAARHAMVRLAPPVDTVRFRPRTPPDRPTVIAAGRFIAQKGFDGLLTAWAHLLGRWSGPPPELILVGDGPQRRHLVSRARRLHPAGTVRFTGAVAHARMPELLASAHVFALPVRTRLGGLNPEGLGLVYAEAAACGLAVIAGDSGGTRDTVLVGESGFLVHPDDPLALAEHLGELLTDLPRAGAMGEAGRHHVQQRFSPTTTATVLRQVLDLG